MRKLVEETLKAFGYYTPDSANLVLGTIAQESAYGKYHRQIGNGPALGIAQMEPNTFNDIVKNFLLYRPYTLDLIKKVCGVTKLKAEDLETNDKLAICMCRVQYLRFKNPIPHDLAGYATLWKLRYNTPLGAGTVEEFILNYNKYVLNDIN
jgi:hypothetical protein